MTKILVLMFCFVTTPAWGQVACINADEGKDKLMTIGQLPIFAGLSKRGHITEIWLNHTDTTWTALYILPQQQKLMCIVDSGTISSQLKPKTDQRAESK